MMKVKCDCKHEFQDKEHGKGVRVANPTAKTHPDGTQDFRCTVCSKIHRAEKECKT